MLKDLVNLTHVARINAVSVQDGGEGALRQLPSGFESDELGRCGGDIYGKQRVDHEANVVPLRPRLAPQRRVGVGRADRVGAEELGPEEDR